MARSLSRRVLWRIEWHLLLKLIEARTILLIFNLREERRRRRSQMLPINALEEGMLLDLVNTANTEPVLGVAHQSLQEVRGRG